MEDVTIVEILHDVFYDDFHNEYVLVVSTYDEVGDLVEDEIRSTDLADLEAIQEGQTVQLTWNEAEMYWEGD